MLGIAGCQAMGVTFVMAREEWGCCCAEFGAVDTINTPNWVVDL